MIGDNGDVSWCVIWCEKDSSDPRITSGIATREIALAIAREYESQGSQIVLVAEAGDLLRLGRRESYGD
jgi:hypothetical protein